MVISIGGPRNVQGSSSIRKKETRKAGGNFSEYLSAEEVAAPKQAGSVQATGLIGAMLAMEEEQSATNKPIRRGHRLLDNLEEVRYALLAGGVPESAMRRLQSEVAAERGDIIDPHLLEILDEIETRAAVELAKLDIAKSLEKE